MKKTILFLSILALINSCSSRKKKNDSTFMKGFHTYYNTLFNSKDALESEIDTRKKAFKDNFYADYIPLLKYEDQPLGSDINTPIFNDSRSSTPPSPSGNFSTGGSRQGTKKGATTLEISEAKALKAIEKYSVMKSGEEKNKKIFDAYILLAQSRIYQGKPLEALDAVNAIFNNMPKDKRLPLAKIYQGQAFAKMGDYYRANEVFLDLKNDKKVKKEYQKLLSVYYSEMLLHSGKNDEAIAELEDAFSLNKNRELRSRIAFLRGQILAKSGKMEDARAAVPPARRHPALVLHRLLEPRTEAVGA